jgi:membrane-bound metal-dependent hydrolase YbcI (DUF457 family)
MLVGGGSLAAVLSSGVYRPELPTALTLLSISLLGALFPDTDTDSKGQNFFYTCLAILDLALMIKGHYRWAAIVGFCAMLPAVGHHRGWTHTWWAMILIPLPILILPGIFYKTPLRVMLPYYLAAVLGYFSHLALDRKF